MQQSGYLRHWQPMLSEWITRVVNTPLNTEGIRLSDITPGNRLIEMEFYLPIDGLLTAPALDALMRQDPLSRQAPPLDFRQVQGMLKGFIDRYFAGRANTICWITNLTGWARAIRHTHRRRWRRR